MLSATLQEGLTGYAIGAKIRSLRLKKKMGLVELGKHTGLSPAMLSKIERGRLFPTLPTLLRIALVFSVGLDYFFVGRREKPLVAITRKDERVMLPDRPGSESTYRFASLDYTATERRFNTYFAEFTAGGSESPRPHSHAGVEFIFVLQGILCVHMDDDTHTLRSGDSIYFDSTHPHAYSRGTAHACSGLVVTSG
jgi:transcriptional regulator with XRE-family HTH domain